MKRVQVSLRMIGLLVFLLCVQGLYPDQICAQHPPCTPEDLKISPTDPLRYQQVEDRCEGTYIQQVASATLELVSLTESVEAFDVNTGKDLLIEWTPVSGTKMLHIQSLSIRPKVYYRMNKSVPIDGIPYRWSMTRLPNANISSNRDLGFTGQTRYVYKDKEFDVYLPLRIRQQGQAQRSQNYRVVLLPGRELTEVLFSLATVNAEGRSGTYLKTKESLGSGYYPTEQGIDLVIPKPAKAGLYALQIEATMKSGGTVSIQCYFYHAG
jgi:hypothetical protein